HTTLFRSEPGIALISLVGLRMIDVPLEVRLAERHPRADSEGLLVLAFAVGDRDLDDAANEVVRVALVAVHDTEVTVEKPLSGISRLIPVGRRAETPFERNALMDRSTYRACPGRSHEV